MIERLLIAVGSAVFFAMFYGWLVANTGGLIGLGNMVRALYGGGDERK